MTNTLEELFTYFFFDPLIIFYWEMLVWSILYIFSLSWMSSFLLISTLYILNTNTFKTNAFKTFKTCINCKILQILSFMLACFFTFSVAFFDLKKNFPIKMELNLLLVIFFCYTLEVFVTCIRNLWKHQGHKKLYAFIYRKLFYNLLLLELKPIRNWYLIFMHDIKKSKYRGLLGSSMC